MSRRLTKVRYDEKKVEIHFERMRLGETDEFALKCSDAPLIDFTQALDALAEHIVTMIGVPRTWKLGLKVRGVTFSYAGENDTMGAVITALKTLETTLGPLVVNTPHATVEPYNAEGDPSRCLTADCVKALRALETQAWRYVDGIRVQGDIFADADAPAGATA